MNDYRAMQTVHAGYSRIGAWIRRIFRTWIALATAPAFQRRQVPVIRQMSTVECGAACLAMILGYHGRHTAISACREQCSAGRDGLTAQALAQAARQHGLRVKAYSTEPADFQYIQLPAVVHWNFNHFVVVERWSPQQVTVVDPALGRRRLTAAEFDAAFTGVVLTFEPGVQFARRSPPVQPGWRTMLGQMLHMPGMGGLLAQILAASLLLQGLGLALPLLTKVLVDQVLPFHIDTIMPMLGMGMAILVLMQAVIGYLRAALLIYLRARLDTQMMFNFFEHVLTLPFRFFQQRTSGDLLMRLGSNVTIRETLTNQTLSALLDGSFVLAYLAIILAQAPFFGALVLGIGLLQVALLLGTTHRVHDLTQRELAAQADAQTYLVEALSGIATLKASGAEERALAHWSDLFTKHLNVSLQRSQLSALVDTAMTALRTAAPLLLLWVGALRVLDGSMSLGTMLALNALATAFLTPLASLVANGRQFQLTGAHLERLTDVLAAEPEQRLQEVRPAPRLSGRIDVQNVGFRYDANAAWALRDISLAIQPGQKVALVGRTGSGKSTLALLLLGLYTPTAGQIRYDGIPLQDLDYRTLRRQFGIVLQDPFLFSGSIRQNIALNDPDLSLDQIVAAARQAAIHEEIVQMPMGYETILAEGGTGLSGGQRQRLALARALVHRPAILVLDEATSHLDAVTEQRVDQNLNKLPCTRIAIAHRLSTIRNADHILVLDGGCIVEQGSHAELLAQAGTYATLYSPRSKVQSLDCRLP